MLFAPERLESHCNDKVKENGVAIQIDAVQAERIGRLASEGAFPDTSQVLNEAFDLLENKLKREHLHRLLQHGLDSGDPRELTEESIEDIDLRAQRRAHAARVSSSDVIVVRILPSGLDPDGRLHP